MLPLEGDRDEISRCAARSIEDPNRQNVGIVYVRKRQIDEFKRRQEPKRGCM